MRNGYCWGARHSGNIGDGELFGLPNTPSATLVAGGQIKWSQIEGDLSHTCGIEKGTGDVYCWRNNNDAQLGVEPSGEYPDRTSSPKKTTSGFKAISIAALDGNTCAVDPSGAAYCWGMDDGTGVIANGE